MRKPISYVPAAKVPPPLAAAASLRPASTAPAACLLRRQLLLRLLRLLRVLLLLLNAGPCQPGLCCSATEAPTNKPLRLPSHRLSQRHLQEHGEVHLSALGIACSSMVTVAEILKARK
jgi:hypothetical protein